MFSAIGRRLPAHATALGKAMLAELDDERVRATVGDPLPVITEHTIGTAAELVDRLATVRERGYATDDEESCIGMRCFAVALPFGSPARDAISCSVPFARLDPARADEIVGLLLETRDAFARQSAGRRF